MYNKGKGGSLMVHEKIILTTECEHCFNSDTCMIMNSYKRNDFVVSVNSNFHLEPYKPPECEELKCSLSSLILY